MPGTRLPLAGGVYFGVAWLPNDEIVIGYVPDPDAPGAPEALAQLAPDQSSFDRLALPEDPGCRLNAYLDPTRLPDGRLGALYVCQPEPESSIAELFLIAHDMETGDTETLVELGYNPSQFTWNPTMDRGMFSAGGRICQSIAWMTRDGIEDAEVTVADDQYAFRMDDAFDVIREFGCDETGRADLPAWSPDGTQIAFFGSPQSIGTRGQTRLDVPWHLYVMAATDLDPQLTEAPDVSHPRDLAWSPDGTWLAFGGELAGEEGGAWIFNPVTDELRRITDLYLNSLAWSPDGNQIIGMHDVADITAPEREVELRVFEVPER